MSKESIRKQIEKAKERTAKVLKDGKTSPETKALIESLLIILEIVVAVLLEKKVRKNSSNSGLPPSSDFGGKNDRNKPGDSDRKKRGEQLDNTREVKTVKIATVNLVMFRH